MNVETNMNNGKTMAVTDVSPEELTLDEKPGESASVPPMLTLREAALALGKSLRALERSLLGRWGNRLPEGWTARKISTESGYEWRIIPPLGFNLRYDFLTDTRTPQPDQIDITKSKAGPPQSSTALKKRITDEATIVIDRTNEVEHLLRELLQTQKQLSEERRHRLEDVRLITQMQSSMRLLEDKANETKKLKDELACAQQEFAQLKTQYLNLLKLPWWKRLFFSSHK